MVNIKLIIAVSKDGTMGVDNKLPWKLSDDLKQFKKQTNHSPLIMGSNTFNSLPGILPNREHIVLSSTMYGDENKSVFTSIKEAIEYLNESDYTDVYVIGGANIIQQFGEMNMFDELIITHVDCDVIGDTVINLDITLKIDKWDIYETTQYLKNESNEFDFTINKYIRKKKRFY